MTQLAEEIAREFGTPAVAVDLDRVERNIARLQAACEASGVANRPHIKTHKSPIIAALQRDAGARGITCQKLGEAEIMTDAGFDDILISYNILGEEHIGRLASLMAKARMTVCADNPTAVDAAADAARRAGRPLDVLVECDTGRKRAGVETVAEAVALARTIADRDGLEFAGFLLYPPETAIAETQRFFDQACDALRECGLAPRIVSSGGTPNITNLGKIRGATEHRAGTYVFNDRMMLACGR
jgi:D-serine deaminase-like pyridoxal phosphate-dependent protein